MLEMAACVSRSYINIYHRVIKNLYLKSNRCLCTRKEDKSGSSNASPAAANDQNVTTRKADVKEEQNLSQDSIHSSNKGFENNVQSKAYGSHKTDSIVEDTSKNGEDQAVQTRLLSVLSDLKVIGSFTKKGLSDNLSRPPKRIGKQKDEVEIQLRKNKRIGYGKEMGDAVKAVASTLGGDAKKTEQELVHTLTSIDNGLQIEQQKNENELEKENDKPHVDEDMVSAVKAVASSLAGEPEKTESELTKKLLSLAAERNAVEENLKPIDISAVFEGMKVDKRKLEGRKESQFVKTQFSARQVTKVLQVDVFNAAPLNIFNLENKERSNEAPKMLLWDDLQRKELQSLVQYAPTNPYEEIIQWTEQGKFWTFPINNEAGMEEEEKVSFHQHVFLDYLLEGFPKKGPIRHFMELVITGLSKNPYCSIQRKAEHVEWFRKYFKEKEDILKQYEGTI